MYCRKETIFTVWLTLQEAYIAELDAKSGASLKLTVLNPLGRIWTMIAGGGASVIYRYTMKTDIPYTIACFYGSSTANIDSFLH